MLQNKTEGHPEWEEEQMETTRCWHPWWTVLGLPSPHLPSHVQFPVETQGWGPCYVSRSDGTMQHITPSLAWSGGPRSVTIVVAAYVCLLVIRDAYLLERRPSIFLLHVRRGGSMVLAGLLNSHRLIYWAFMRRLLHAWLWVPEWSQAESSPTLGLCRQSQPLRQSTLGV